MKRKLAALLAATLLLTGCSTSDNSLIGWVKEAGLALVLENTSDTISEVAASLDGLGSSPEDIRIMVTALKTSAGALAAQVTALAAEPLSSDSAYEQLRQDLIESMQAYVSAAQALDADQIIESGNLAATTAVITALTAITQKLTALSDYLEANGDTTVGSA